MSYTYRPKSSLDKNTANAISVFKKQLSGKYTSANYAAPVSYTHLEVAKASVKDPNIFSTTADIVNGPDKAEILELLKPLKEQEKLYRGSGANGFLQCMLSDISVDTNEAKLF